VRVLARQPTSQEISLALNHVKSAGDRGTGFEDLLWAMLNSAEFLARR
ncbi:MAG: hypothetical protein IT424_11695, partial [Pirellulales bacterium]|nr:hypothetical protein [Pirellulales bacterium]